DPAIRWFNAEGEQMQPGHWGQHHARSLAYMVSPGGTRGDRHYLVLFNAADEYVFVKLPLLQEVACWQPLLDTNIADGKPPKESPLCWLEVDLDAFSCMVLLGHEPPISDMVDVQLVA